MKYRILLSISIFLFSISIAGAQIYVKQGGGGVQDGTDWLNAMSNLQAAINGANEGEEVWVAEGTYQPSSGQSFIMKEGVRIYGGFPNTGNPDMADRDWEAYETILQGNGNSVIRNENNGLTASAVLDGFTITGGNGYQGGGIYNEQSSPTLTHLIIEENKAVQNSTGGGIYNIQSSPTLTHVTIRGNSAGNAGGGMVNAGYSFPTLINVSISGNNAENGGGGTYNIHSSPTLINVTISGNTSVYSGGGMYNFHNSFPTLINVTISGNSAGTEGGGMYNDSDSSPKLYNTIVLGNNSGISGDAIDGSSSNNLIQTGDETSGGEYNGFGGLVLNTSPADIFMDPKAPGDAPTTDGDYSLRAGSWAIDKGDNSFNTSTTDLAGNPRINGGTIDLGAYEAQAHQTRTYVDVSNVSGNYDGLSWATAFRKFEEGVNAAFPGDTVFVAKGTYQPESGQFFTMKEEVKIFGGFAGTEGSLSERDLAAGHTSILRGNGNSVIRNENNNLTAAAVLDGFTITGGNNTLQGGGIYNNQSSPTLTNLTIRDNNAADQGGGVYNYNNSSPTLSNVMISGNEISTNAGGGIYNDDHSSPHLTNVIIRGNTAPLGGGIYNKDHSSPNLINVTISGNSAIFGGGIGNEDSSPTLINVVISENDASIGGGIYNFSGKGIFTNVTVANNGSTGFYASGSSWYNSIIWDEIYESDYSVQNSLIKGDSSTDNGNIDATNLSATDIFEDPDNGNYHLIACSPAVDAGDNARFPDLDEDSEDVDGNPRVYDFGSSGLIDLGAYEFQGEALDYSAVVFSDATITYDGLPHTLTAMNLPPGASVSYTIRDSDGNEVDEAIDVGTYTVTATLSGFCPDEERTAVLSITTPVAIHAPNCGNFSPAIGADGTVIVSGDDFVTNHSAGVYPLTITVHNQWGGLLSGWPQTFYASSDIYEWEVCAYLGQKLQFSVENKIGQCSNGWMDLDQMPGMVLTTRLTDDRPWVDKYAEIGEKGKSYGSGELLWMGSGKMVFYCGEPIPVIRPEVTTPCGGRYTGPKMQPDWVMMPVNDGCKGVNDTAEIIYRTWEVYDKDNNVTTMTDTIIVIKLPQLSAGSFVGDRVDSVYCKLHAGTLSGELNITYNAWKQATGIHDYELPYNKMGGLIYELPKSIMDYEEGKAIDCGSHDDYLSQVIMIKANGDPVMIADVMGLTGNNPHGHDAPMEYVNLHYDGNPPTPGTQPYLILKVGDRVLSEDGKMVIVAEDWFYNGHGNNPFWFSGGWPAVCGGGECTYFCDVVPDAEGVCIQILVPGLIADAQGTPMAGECDTICLPVGTHCGIDIITEGLSDAVGECPFYVGGETKVIQTCWAETGSVGFDEGEPQPGCSNQESDIVTDVTYYENKSVFELYHKTYHIDDLPPIFDFCYSACINEPIEDLEEFFAGAVAAGIQHECADEWERDHPTVYTTGTHDCAAEVYVPDVKVIDNCSGIHSVTAEMAVPGGSRRVELEATDSEIRILPSGDTCEVVTYSHISDPIRVPFNGCNGDLISVEYDASDNCWNMSEWTKYITIEDRTRPKAISNTNVSATVTDGYTCVTAEKSYDEGSWDNCAIDLMLARRVDWIEAYVDVCGALGDGLPSSWAEVFAALGVSGPGSGVDVDVLASIFAGQGDVGDHYAYELGWLDDNGGDAGEKAIQGWVYDMARYIAENCSEVDPLGNTLNPQKINDEFDKFFGSGVANEISYLGGGWVRCVPFVCEDACESIPSELVVFDFCQNFAISGTDTHIEDAGRARVVKQLDDIAVSCEAYNINYKDIADAAAAYNADGGSAADTTGVYAQIDSLFGTYILAQVDNAGNPVGVEADDLVFNYTNVTCGEEDSIRLADKFDHDGKRTQEAFTDRRTTLEEREISGDNGVIAINCAGGISQDIWIDLDECGQGEIIRRFFVNGGCDDDNVTEIWQRITVESACAMTESMFDKPGQVGTASNPICLPQDLSKDYLPDTIGELVVKDHLVGKICNSIAIGHDVQKRNVSGVEGLVQYEITWSAVDWCCAYDSPDREYYWRQKVMARISPDCEMIDDGDNNSGSEGGLIQGTIATEKGEPVQKVEMKAVSGTGSPMTTVTSGDGSYSFSMNQGMNVSLIPSENTGFSNGVSTLDLIDIQRHVLQKRPLESDYQRIAADVNGNGGIDAFDIAELRRLILQPDSYQFVNNTSWRFFDKKTNKEVFEVTNLNGDVNVDWVGVKIGDVNMDGDPARVAGTRHKVSGELGVNLNIADKRLTAGETYRVDVTSDNFVNIVGMQYTLSYLRAMVEVESIEAGVLNITQDNFFRYAPGVITASWNEADGQNLSSDAVLFTMVLRAKSSVQLKDVISLNSRVTAKEAYSSDGDLMEVNLRFDGEDIGFALYQNTPNPYAGETTIGFKLPQATSATISVYDVTGKVLKVIEGEYNAGYNEVRLRSGDLKVTGVFYYQLDTDKFTATRKMIMVE